MAPPAQIHTESAPGITSASDKLENQMQEFINSQKMMQAQSQP